MKILNVFRIFGFFKTKKQTLTPVKGTYPGKTNKKIEMIPQHKNYSHIFLEHPIGYINRDLGVEEWILKRIGKGKRVLDTGCANGSRSEKIARRNNEVFAIDAWEAGVNRTNKRKGIKAFVVDMNSQKFPFVDEFFDFIFSSDVYEHILDWHHYISECYRVLKVGGEIILSTPNRFNLGNRLRMLFDLWEWKFNDYRIWSPRMVKKTLEITGFKVIMYPNSKLPYILNKFKINIEVIGIKKNRLKKS